MPHAYSVEDSMRWSCYLFSLDFRLPGVVCTIDTYLYLGYTWNMETERQEIAKSCEKEDVVLEKNTFHLNKVM